MLDAFVFLLQMTTNFSNIFASTNGDLLHTFNFLLHGRVRNVAIFFHKFYTPPEKMLQAMLHAHKKTWVGKFGVALIGRPRSHT